MEPTDNTLEDLDDIVRGTQAQIPEDLLWSFRVIRRIESYAKGTCPLGEHITVKGTLDVLDYLFEGKYPLSSVYKKRRDLGYIDEHDLPDDLYRRSSVVTDYAYPSGISYVSQGLFASESFFIRAAFLSLQYERFTRYNDATDKPGVEPEYLMANTRLVSSLPFSVGTVAPSSVIPNSMYIATFNQKTYEKTSPIPTPVHKGDLVSLWTAYETESNSTRMQGAFTIDKSHPFTVGRLKRALLDWKIMNRQVI